jgi:phage replication O-like protein O
MANPKIENGYFRTANELGEALAKIRIPGQARQIFDFIFRKTDGYGKTEDWISLGQFIKGTGIPDKKGVIRAIHKLEIMNLIGKKANESEPSYWINKDYDTWKPLAKMPTLAKRSTSVGRKANKPLAVKPPTINNITKDNITKNIISVNSSKIAEFTKLYHSLCPFGTKVQAMSLKRLSSIKAILKKHPTLTWWEEILANKVASSAFLRGEIPPSGGHKQFKLTIDFLCVEHNLVKIIEGNYDDRSDSSRKRSFLDQL